MSNIPASNYVNISSQTIGTQAVATRQLYGRLFSQHERLSLGTVYEFSSYSDVRAFFGGDDNYEARAASFYFNFTSPRGGRPQRLQFARYTTSAMAPRIIGGRPSAVGDFKALGDGSITLSKGAESYRVTISGLNGTDVQSLSDVARLLQEQIRAAGTTNQTQTVKTADSSDDKDGKSGTTTTTTAVASNWLSGVSVSYAAGYPAFILSGSQNESAMITVDDTPLTQLLAWNEANGKDASRYTKGQAIAGSDVAVTLASAIATADQASNNYGSVAAVTLSTDVDSAYDAAAMLSSLGTNTYLFCLGMDVANMSNITAHYQRMKGISVAPTAVTSGGDFMYLAPMAMAAATNYENRNATFDYMFRQFNSQTPAVSDAATATALDKLKVNYLGQTQTAGKTYAFYQRALMWGESTSPADQNVYVNEQWLQSRATSAFFTRLLGGAELPANAQGTSVVLSTLADVVNSAVTNGVISPGKTLDEQQKQAVFDETSDPDAWTQVESAGYWYTATISRVVNQDTNEYESRITYKLVYSKKDEVRQIVGQHRLV